MEREEINEKLSMLGRRMEELKLEIHSATTATSATFANFEPSFDVTATLSDKVKAVSDEMQELSDKIETEVRNFSWFFYLIIQVLHAFCWGDETETKPLCVYSQPSKGSLFF